MIFITGDCHSDFRRFSTEVFPEQREMTKDDYVIICGDFGGIWYKEDPRDQKSEKHWLDWLEAKPFTTLFVDGNHENFDRLYAFPEEEWHGGKIHKIRSSIYHLMRGEIFEIDGKKIFAFGGAASHDIQGGIIEYDEEGKWKKELKRREKRGLFCRVRNLTWWEAELPSEKELKNGMENLFKNQYEVDFIVSHCCPTKIQAIFSMGEYKSDRLTQYFDEISEKVKFKKWFFGHYHNNQQVLDSYIMLYEQIVRIS